MDQVKSNPFGVKPLSLAIRHIIYSQNPAPLTKLQKEFRDRIVDHFKKVVSQ